MRKVSVPYGFFSGFFPHFFSTLLFVLLTLGLLPTPGAGAGALKDRMRARQPEIIQLKASGRLGENNLGFLEIRQGNADRPLVDEENQDRRQVYQRIAEHQQTSAELVGRRRAAQIAERAAPGTWLQSPRGDWYRK